MPVFFSWFVLTYHKATHSAWMPKFLPSCYQQGRGQGHTLCSRNPLFPTNHVAREKSRLLESLFIKASQHENPSGQNPTAGCFFIFMFDYFCTSVYICALKPDIVPFVDSHLPLVACSLPSIGTAAVSFRIPEPTPVDIVDENPGKHHVHYPSLSILVPLSTCMCTLQVCWHLLTLYIYICIIWITMTNIDKWYLNNGGSGPLHLIGDLPQHVLFLEISGDWTIKQWQQWHSPLCTPLSTKDLKSANPG